MRPEHEEILSAFFDGEEVPPAELAEALQSPEACSLLRAWAELRLEVGYDDGAPESLLRPRPQLPPRRGEPWWRRRTPVPWGVLAASVFLLAVLSLWAGRLLGPDMPAEEGELPPTPERVLRFELTELR